MGAYAASNKRVHDKGTGYILFAQLLQTDREYLQTNISSITKVQAFMYLHILCVKYHSYEFLTGKFLQKLRVHHSGKFVPRENNLLYGIDLQKV